MAELGWFDQAVDPLIRRRSDAIRALRWRWMVNDGGYSLRSDDIDSQYLDPISGGGVGVPFTSGRGGRTVLCGRRMAHASHLPRGRQRTAVNSMRRVSREGLSNASCRSIRMVVPSTGRRTVSTS